MPDLIPKIKSPADIKTALTQKKDDDPLGARRDGMARLPAIVSKLVEIGEQIDTIQSPTARAAALSFFEGRFSRALGFDVDIPTPQDIEVQELRRRKERGDLLKAVAQQDLRQARAFLMDAPEAKQFGDVGELMKDPDQMVGILNKLGIKSITRATFELAEDELAGVSQADVAGAKADKVAKNRNRESQALLDITQIGAREQALDEPIETSLEQAGEAAGVSLGGIFSDIDEDRGSAALLAAYDSIRRTLGPDVTPSVARRFLAQMKDDLADQLSDLPTNDKGELMVGAGDMGVTSAATVNLGSLLLMLGKDMGVSPTDVMKMLELPYSGVDIESVKVGQAALAKQFGETQQTVSRALGLSDLNER